MAEVIDLVSDKEDDDEVVIVKTVAAKPRENPTLLQHEFDMELDVVGKPKAWQRRKVYYRKVSNRWIHNHVNPNRAATNTFKACVLQRITDNYLEFPITPQFYPLSKEGPVHLELEFQRRPPQQCLCWRKED